MNKEIKDIRIYLINQPGNYSCGYCYITNNDNKIILYSPNNVELLQPAGGFPIYTLAPYPIPKKYNRQKFLAKETVVYPSCDVDTPSLESGIETEFHPTIVGRVLLTRAELDNFVKEYSKKFNDYEERLSQDLEKLTAEFELRKADIIKNHRKPSLTELIRNSLSS